MKTYIEAYRERLERNDSRLKKLATELILLGCKVFIPKERLANLIFVVKGDKHINVVFGEVPYRWYLSMEYKPSKENGSGRTLETSHLIDEMPYSAEYVLSKMQPNPEVKEFNNPYYLTEFTGLCDGNCGMNYCDENGCQNNKNPSGKLFPKPQ